MTNEQIAALYAAVDRLRANGEPQAVWVIKGMIGEIRDELDPVGNQIAALVADNERLRGALDQIACNPYMAYDSPRLAQWDTPYKTGIVDGHRLAATWAKEALAAPPPAVVAEWAAAKALAEASDQRWDGVFDYEETKARIWRYRAAKEAAR